MEWHHRVEKVLALLIAIATTTNLAHAQLVDPCNPSPCRNGGMCYEITDITYFCYCADTGFSGVNCERRIQACPPDIPEVECFSDPCNGASCPGRTDATCQANYCGQCSAEFFDSAGNQVDCSCQDSSAVECDLGSCDQADCPLYPNAECRSNSCGGCNTAFFQNGLEIFECRQTSCPRGLPTFRCFADPCSLETCASDPSARCIPNYCGGCMAEFYNSAGERVDCGSCPMGSEVECELNPCAVTSCPAYPNARCQVTNCGMCAAVYYDEDSNMVECDLDYECVDEGVTYGTGESFLNAECRQCYCLMGLVICSQDVEPDCVVGIVTEAPPQDLCDSSPCFNGGVCQTDGSVFYCRCPPGYAGQRCDQVTIPDPCASFPCINGGTCYRSADANRYTCDCPQRYLGDNCERANRCIPSPCRNGGSCTLTADSIPVCECPFGYQGSFCEEPVDFCASEEIVCANAGTCESHESYAVCICPPGYSGISCEETVDPCDPSPCQNQGFCQRLQGAANNYVCLCVMGYTGANCETARSVCDNFPCRNGGSCEEITTSVNIRSFSCDCPAGYTGSMCELIDEDPCSRLPCVNGLCFPINPVLGICLCSPGYIGDACDMLVDPCIDITCQNNGRCESEGTLVRCECQPGYAGDRCQILFSPCEASPCFNQGSCVPDMSSARGYVCDCPERFEGDNCQMVVTSPCFPDPCENGICVISNVDSRRALCLCEVGYTGPRCEQSLDPCQSNPCLNGARCIPLSSGEGYFCNCTESFMGRRCEQQVLCNPNPCFNGGSCQRESMTEYSCRCQDGYVGDRCQVLQNPCVNNNCINGECQPFRRGYTCNCYDGYTGVTCEEQDGCPLTCPEDISLPAVPNQRFYQVIWDLPETVCGYQTLPSSSPGSYFPVGQNPVQVSFLAENDTAVDRCTFSITIGDGSETPACDSGPCENGATCVDLRADLFICICPTTHRGQYCQEMIPTEPCDATPCLNEGICLNIPQIPMGYLCICRPEYIGAQCGVPNDACASEPCQNRATCTPLDDSYVCLCEAAYMGVDCEMTRTCFTEPCENGGLCVELGDGGYSCTCPPGFTGPGCEAVDRCNPIPCLNRGLCINRESSYECRCSQGYSGDRCEIDDSQCILECPDDITRTVSPNAIFAPVRWAYEPTVCGLPVMFTYMPGSSFPLGSTVVMGAIQNANMLKECNFTVNIVQFDPCVSSPCENNGLCQRVADSFVCQCPMGYMGLRCETPTTPEVSEACQSEPCQNGATCFGDEENYFCLCLEGFTGEQCEEPIPGDACESRPCQNGGTCIGLVDGFSCLCEEGFSGETCSDDEMMDLTPPRLDSCPRIVAETAPLQEGGATVFWSEPRATDDSGFTSIASQTRQSGGFFPFGNTTVVYHIEDPSGNSVFCVFVVAVGVEMMNPGCMPECPADINVVTDGDLGFARVYWSLSSLSCEYSVQSSHQSGNFFQLGSQAVSIEFVEGREVVYECAFAVTVTRGTRHFCNLNPCQHLGTCQDRIDRYECICARGFSGRNCEVVTSVDEMPPVVSFCPADISTRTLIGAPNATATWRDARAVDTSGTVTVSFQSHSPGDSFVVGVTTVTYEFCDPSGNKAICQFRVAVESAEECRVRCPEDISKFADDGVSFINVTWEQPETMCGYPVTSSPLPGSFFPHGNTRVTVMTVDGDENVVDQCNFTVAIQREIFGNPCNNPIICGLGECILDDTMRDGFRCSCTRCFSGDYCERALPVANPCRSNMGNLCQNGGTCNFIDCDFSCTCPEEYTGEYCQIERVFLDMVPPTLIGCPVDITRTVGENEEGGVVTWDRVRFRDDSGTAYFVGGNYASGDVFPLGLTNVRLIYSDASLNFEYCTFNVLIQRVNVACDTFVCPEDLLQFNIGNLEYMEVFWEQVDTVCGLSIVSTPETGDLFPIGTSPVTWTMYDSEGNPRSGCTFSVMVINDFTNPCFQEPCSPDEECVPSATNPAGFNCRCRLSLGVVGCNFGVDEDTEPPEVTKGCNNRTTFVELGITTHSFQWSEPEFTDNNGVAQVTTTVSHEQGYEFTVDEATLISYNFTDQAGNTATCNFTITVASQDTQAPNVTNCISPQGNPNQYLQAAGSYVYVDYQEPTAVDNSGFFSVSVSPTEHSTGGFFTVGQSHTVIWSFQDGSGNEALCSIVIQL